MPRKKASRRSDTDDLTLELSRRLGRTRGATTAGSDPEETSLPAGERDARSDAVDELMKRYSRSSPRRPKSASEPSET